MMPIALNGRFLSQPLTGVQRFAGEITRALDGLAAEGRLAGARLLRPPGEAATPFRHLVDEPFGPLSGQAWEQAVLPRHLRGALLLSLGNTAPLALGARQVVVIHDAGIFDTPESYAWQFRLWYRAMQTGLARLGARIVTVSAFSRGRIAQALRLDPARIAVIAEGHEHIFRSAAEPAVLARHGLLPGRFALVVGTGAAHKNLAALGGAAALLAARGLVLAVAGAADPAVFRAAGGAAGKLLGRVSDAELRALYEAAFCLVFPSRYEGFGLPPLEAMACGCPVVAAAAGAVPEVCGDAALWFDRAGGDTLPESLARLIDESGLAAELRVRGRARAAQYTWRGAAERLLACLPEEGRA